MAAAQQAISTTYSMNSGQLLGSVMSSSAWPAPIRITNTTRYTDTYSSACTSAHIRGVTPWKFSRPRADTYAVLLRNTICRNMIQVVAPSSEKVCTSIPRM